jgi:MoaA/NifB/PqqE/SkfB family radical SAM enzyme
LPRHCASPAAAIQRESVLSGFGLSAPGGIVGALRAPEPPGAGGGASGREGTVGEFVLATRGMGGAAQLRILKRHAYSVLRHMTPAKLANLLRAETAAVLRRPRLGSHPYILKIESTNICSLRCRYCYDDRRAPREGERPYGRMSFEQFAKIVDEVGRYLFKINLYGFGEPWLFPETFEMIRYATDRNIGVGVSSNMNHRDPAINERIVASGLEVLIFSCHGATPESYRRFMGATGDMERALGNIREVVAVRRRLGRATPLIDWQFCVTGFNEGEIGAARRLAAELGVDQIRFVRPLFPADAGPEWFSQMFPRIQDEADAKPPTHCPWLYRSAYVSHDGGVLPCCRDTRVLANDYGNVGERGFGAIWNNPAYVASRRMVAHPQLRVEQPRTLCASCPIVLERGRARR